MSEDAAATYIAWLTQCDVKPRLLLEWRNRGIGPDYFQPQGTRIMTYQQRSIDVWFWGSRKELVESKAA